MREANILLAAKQEKAAKLREECLARQQEKLKAAAQRVEAVEQRLMARMLQKHEAVEGRLTAAQHIHEERVEEKRKRATAENQKVAEVAFINQLTEQMGGTDRKAALDKKLSRTEQRRKQRQAERLQVVTQQAAKHRLTLERRAQQVDDKEAVIARIQTKLDEARKRRQQRRHADAAAAAAAQHESAQLPVSVDEQLSEGAAGGMDGAACLHFPSSIDLADDESFSAIDFHSHHTQQWIQAQRLDSAEELLAMDDAVCTPTHPHGRPVRRRQARPASSPAPTKHQKGTTATDHKLARQTDAWAAGAHYHMQQYTQPPSPSADSTRVITIQQLRRMDGLHHNNTHSTDEDDERHSTDHTARRALTTARNSSSSSRSRRRRRAAHESEQSQSSTADSHSPYLGCLQCPQCSVLLPDATYLSRHVGSQQHQQAAALRATSENCMSPPLWVSWADMGRSFVQAPSKSSRRNAKKRTNKLKQHANRLLPATSLGPADDKQRTDEPVQPFDMAQTHSARPALLQPAVDVAMLAKPIASLLQQLDEAVGVQDGAVQYGGDWLSALLLRLQTADSSLRRDLLLSTAADSWTAFQGHRAGEQWGTAWPGNRAEEEKESLVLLPVVSTDSSSVYCVLVATLLSRCLCVAYPTDILAAACQLINTILTIPTAQQPLISTLLLQQRLVPAVCSFNGCLCTVLAQAAQSQRAVQCDEYHTGMFTLLSSALSIAARTQPSAGTALLRVMAVCGLLRRSSQMLLYLASQLSSQHTCSHQSTTVSASLLPATVAGSGRGSGGMQRPVSASLSPSCCLSAECRGCSVLRCGLSIVRLASAALTALTADGAIAADVPSSFHSTALLAVVPMLHAVSAAWCDERLSCSNANHPSPSGPAACSALFSCLLPSVACLVDACLDVCLQCTAVDGSVSLFLCAPSPLPLLHSALSRLAFVASTRSMACIGTVGIDKGRVSTAAVLQKVAQLSSAISTAVKQSNQSHLDKDELAWNAVCS